MVSYCIWGRCSIVVRCYRFGQLLAFLVFSSFGSQRVKNLYYT
uniref:Uncharacterized protein n=1 Tax=Arundo donax TaxID=35708 RepID=A0A0A9CLH1_ARUDO